MKYKALLFVLCLGLIMTTTAFAKNASGYNYNKVKLVGFRNIEVTNIDRNDSIITNALQLELEEGAKKVKDLKFTYDKSLSSNPDCYIEGSIYKYNLNSVWTDSHASTWTDSSSDTQTWKDRSGKEHEIKTTKYWTVISDNVGGYRFNADVSAEFRVVDAATGNVIFSYYASDSNDKCMDAYKHLVKNFYGKLKKDVNESKKLYK